jgi:hypothetical protein
MSLTLMCPVLRHQHLTTRFLVTLSHRQSSPTVKLTLYVTIHSMDSTDWRESSSQLIPPAHATVMFSSVLRYASRVIVLTFSMYVISLCGHANKFTQEPQEEHRRCVLKGVASSWFACYATRKCQNDLSSLLQAEHVRVTMAKHVWPYAHGTGRKKINKDRKVVKNY